MGGIEFIEKGGVVMYPILACSIFSLAIIIERFISYWRIKKNTRGFLSKVNVLVKSEKVHEAIIECDKTKLPIAAIFKAGLSSKNSDRSELKNIIEEIATLEVVNLEKYLAGLATIATIAPLLGLLGTVTGMVSSFNAIAASTGIGETPALAAGIAEALLTTVFGLSVAIPTVIAHNYLSKQVDNIILIMDKSSLELIDAISDINSKAAKVADDLIKESNIL